MGRYIHCQGEDNYVWKYVFAEQDSEMHRIHDELGLGIYQHVIYDYNEKSKTHEQRPPNEDEFPDGDILELQSDDIPKIKDYLKIHSGEHFHKMLETFVWYMESHSKALYIFEGEF